MAQAEILQLENITKQYFKSPFPAVNAVSFSLQPGDILGLLGSSGCGKTTLLRMIAGFERPQQGSITLNGEKVAGTGIWIPPEQRDVGMVFQDYALFPHLTVAKNVSFGLVNQGRKGARRFTTKQIQDLTAAAIAVVGLSGLEQRYPHELSGGQQQRVALARALAPRPALILLDEPLSNLDVQVRLRLREEIRTVLKTTGTSAIFVTHDQEEALSISDWVAVMKQGQIEQIDRPEDIYLEPTSRFVAEFVTQANFLPATLNGSTWKTEVGCFPSPALPSPSPTADLMIRQEDLHLEPDEAAPVVIRDRQFLGREHRYCLVTPSGQELHALSTNPNLIPIGTRVRLSVAETALRIFPKES
ncbi:MAG: ABC transporter ATP-binding protein [Leptolyngbyaceae cyanobacterium bins.302]|nr:ABC transporter ATP-binding protein [Leptolyngbyaceae cyanobacterium bins.302]